MYACMYLRVYINRTFITKIIASTNTFVVNIVTVIVASIIATLNTNIIASIVRPAKILMFILIFSTCTSKVSVNIDLDDDVC